MPGSTSLFSQPARQASTRRLAFVRSKKRHGLAQQRTRPGYRLLSLDQDTDVAFLWDIFFRRNPTPLVASTCDHPALFMLKAIETPEIELLHLSDLDAVVAVKGRNGPSMTLLDIVAPSIPSLEEIVSALGYAGVRINVHLTPDRLSWAPQEQTPVDNGYMVRGFFAPKGRAFMLSDMRI